MALHTLLPSTWYKLPWQPVGLACLSFLTDAHGRILPTDAFVLQLPSFNWTSSLQMFYFPVLFLVWLCSALVISAHAQMTLYIRTHFVAMRHIYLGYHCHSEHFLSNRGSRNNWFEKFVPGTRNHGHTVKLPFSCRDQSMSCSPSHFKHALIHTSGHWNSAHFYSTLTRVICLTLSI